MVHKYPFLLVVGCYTWGASTWGSVHVLLLGAPETIVAFDCPRDDEGREGRKARCMCVCGARGDEDDLD